MLTLSAIFSGIKGGFDYAFSFFKKKYFFQPKVYISVFRSGGGRKSTLGISDKNERIPMENDPTQFYIDGNNALHFFQMEWVYKLTLWNNSEHTAYNLKLLKPRGNQDCKIEPFIQHLKPLISNTSEDYFLTFSAIVECKAFDSPGIFQNGSTFFKQNKVVLEYTNVKVTRFYTEFDINKDEYVRNSFSKKLKI
jgi:hypothetical protein